MIYLGLDLLMSYFSKIPTYFILLNIVLISKKDFPKLLIITLVLDLLLLNTYFINTIILSIIFIIYKKLKITVINFKNYLISLIIIYLMYIIFLGLINGYNSYLVIFMIKNILYNLIFYALSYKILKNYIKLSR